MLVSFHCGSFQVLTKLAMSKRFIPAKPDPVSKAFWGWYFQRSVRRAFSACWIAGEEHLRTTDTSVPTILACTHGSWWDAALTIVLSLREYGLDADGMMEYKQLTKYRFFSRIGMFSVIREDARSAMASLSYAADRLRTTNRYLWMFPQGTLVHQDLPVVAEPGIGILAAKLGSVRIVPVAMRYELLRSQHPVCWIRVGEPLYVTPDGASTVRSILDDVSNAMNTCSSLLRADAHAERASDYRMFLSGRRSMDAAFDAVTRQ
jgi:chlorobactene lauroyltransferase